MEIKTDLPKDYCPVCGAYGLEACRNDYDEMTVDHPERPTTLGPF